MRIEELSLAEIVTERPTAATLFEKHNLDFCCRGKQKLSEAILNDPLKLKTIVSELELLFQAPIKGDIDLNTLSMSKLIDYIVVNHHAYVKESMPVIQQHLAKVAEKHGDRFPEMIKINELFEEIATDFQHHMMKEELILFPKIKRIESNLDSAEGQHASIRTIINVMEIEHQDSGDLLHKIKELSNNFTAPENACITHKISLEELKIFEADLHKHVHLENNILFPKALNYSEKNNPQQSCAI